MCYYIYNNLPLIGDDFIDERLLAFLRKELGQEEIADKIEKFYVSPSDQDATLIMLLSVMVSMTVLGFTRVSPPRAFGL